MEQNTSTDDRLIAAWKTLLVFGNKAINHFKQLQTNAWWRILGSLSLCGGNVFSFVLVQVLVHVGHWAIEM